MNEKPQGKPKNLILYTSKSGSTRRYAEWIQGETGADLRDLEGFDIADLQDYHKLVIGSSTYVGKITASDFLAESFDQLQQHPVFLFSVGLIPAEDEASRESYLMLPQNVRKHLSGYVKLPGKIDRSKLNMVEKMLIRAMKGKNDDLVDRKQIRPIVDFLQAG